MRITLTDCLLLAILLVLLWKCASCAPATIGEARNHAVVAADNAADSIKDAGRRVH